MSWTNLIYVLTMPGHDAYCLGQMQHKLLLNKAIIMRSHRLSAVDDDVPCLNARQGWGAGNLPNGAEVGAAAGRAFVRPGRIGGPAGGTGGPDEHCGVIR